MKEKPALERGRRTLLQPGQFNAKRRAVSRPNGHAPFVQLYREFVRDLTLSTDARLLGSLLATFANRDGFAWPGATTLRKLTGWGRHRLEAARAELTGGRDPERRKRAWLRASYVRKAGARFDAVRWELQRIARRPLTVSPERGETDGRR